MFLVKSGSRFDDVSFAGMRCVDDVNLAVEEVWSLVLFFLRSEFCWRETCEVALDSSWKALSPYTNFGGYCSLERDCETTALGPGSQQTTAQSQGRGGQSRSRSQQFQQPRVGETQFRPFQQPGLSRFGHSSQPFFSGPQHAQFGPQCPTSPLLPPQKAPLENLIYTTCKDPIPQPAAVRTPRLYQPTAVHSELV
ncbi:hypothetical protein F511_41442 [Dorcoceras hygrometricum]|uniref:Uncharacterized protein n=1 Tax=Dorcoceras hygrometricum TaxID=472368 RepID=A0A2Z7ARW1_9LAMI|nr:hypothetical protein F511_41442 [Dorcoceras hygrometricum]